MFLNESGQDVGVEYGESRGDTVRQARTTFYGDWKRFGRFA
jgi:hypothetical protein